MKKEKFLTVVLISLVIVFVANSLSFAGGTDPEFNLGNITEYSCKDRKIEIQEQHAGVPRLKLIRVVYPRTGRLAKKVVPEGKIPNASNALIVNPNSPINITTNGNYFSFTKSIAGDYSFARIINSKGRTVAEFDDDAMGRVDFQQRTLNINLPSKSENYYVEVRNQYNGKIYDCIYVLLNVRAGKEVYKHNNAPTANPKYEKRMNDSRREYMQQKGITNEMDLTDNDYENIVEASHEKADTPEEKLLNSITKDYMKKHNIPSRSQLTDKDYQKIIDIFTKQYTKNKRSR